jgi:hypothetical protein
MQIEVAWFMRKLTNNDLRIVVAACCCSSSSSSSCHLSSIWSLLQLKNLGEKSNAVARLLAQQQNYMEQ